MEHQSGSAIAARSVFMTAGPGDETAQAAELQTLLERAVEGDAAAFEQVVVRHERRVLTLAWRLLGDMHDAQDAAQEAFLRAFRYIHRFDPRKPFEPWLIHLTVNVCRDIARKRRRLAADPDSPAIIAGRPAEGPDADPESALEAAQRKRDLGAALVRLPEKERLAVILRDIEGYSTAEVASILRSSEGTVRSHVSRGRVRLKGLLERMKKRNRK